MPVAHPNFSSLRLWPSFAFSHVWVVLLLPHSAAPQAGVMLKVACSWILWQTQGHESFLLFFPHNSSLMHRGWNFPPLCVFLYPILECEACILSFRVAQLHYGDTENTLNRSTTNLVVDRPQDAEYARVSPQNKTPEATYANSLRLWLLYWAGCHLLVKEFVLWLYRYCSETAGKWIPGLGQ